MKLGDVIIIDGEVWTIRFPHMSERDVWCAESAHGRFRLIDDRKDRDESDESR